MCAGIFFYIFSSPIDCIQETPGLKNKKLIGPGSSSKDGGEVSLEDEGKKETIKEIFLNPSLYVGREVIVVGRLVNEGKDYFIHSKFVLKDENSNALEVKGWVPLEIPPPRFGDLSKIERPKVMSDYLNKELCLKGKIESEVRNSNTHYYLRVQSAEPIKRPEERW